MSVRAPRLAALLLSAGAMILAAPASALERTPAATGIQSGAASSTVPARKRVVYIDGRPDTSGYFLNDTTVLARVGDRLIRAREFIETYFSSWAEDRPASDSLGRVEWLNSMIDKEVMARVAREVQRPLDFEERAVMREHTERVLSNVLFQRMVMDSVAVDEAAVRALYDELRVEVHLREILCSDRATAEHVRGALAKGQLDWSQAFARYSIASGDRTKGGDLGWITRLTVPPEMAREVWNLPAGAAPVIFKDAQGFHVLQCAGRRPVDLPGLPVMHDMIASYVRNFDRSRRVQRLQGRLRDEIAMRYDSTNIAWAASRFQPTRTTSRTEAGTSLHFHTHLPVFKPADTSRVLARYQGGQLTLRRFMDAYRQIPALKRPSIDTPETFRDEVDTIVLEPYQARIAVERGLDRDSLSIALIEKRREQLMVERMYQDSIEARVRVSPEERRRYYDTHLPRFVTFAEARYAAMQRPSRAAADSLAERLGRGERAEDVLRADSLRSGKPSGSIKVERENDHGTYHVLVFEELKPGERRILGPDKDGRYAVIQLLSFDPGHQLSYEESKGYAQDAVQSLAAEELLQQFLARHRRKFRIESRPELVMRIKLVDPVALER